MMRRALCGCLLTLGLVAHAVEVPKATPYDERIVEVDYFDRNVNRLSVFYGMHLQLVLNRDEVIRRDWIKFGDAKAWDFDVINNRVFIKATADKPETNLTIITNKREYEFVLEAKKPGTVDDKSAQLKVIFNYPHDEFRARSEADRADLARALAEVDERGRPYNFNYDWQGSAQLKPLVVKDDGTHTYMKFARQKEMPAIYAIGPDGTEMPVNFAVEGEYLIVQRTAARFAIRYGDMVTCIRNNAYAGITALSDKSGAE